MSYKAVIAAFALAVTANAALAKDLRDIEKEQALKDDFTQICHYYKKGSIEWRECRRKAQINFREACHRSEDKEGPACIRAHRFNPLG